MLVRCCGNFAGTASHQRRSRHNCWKMLTRFQDKLDLQRYPVRLIFEALSTGRWVPEAKIKEALEIKSDNRSMFAYNSVNREISRLRQQFKKAGIKTVVIARHEIDGPGYVMFEVQHESNLANHSMAD